jgi:hypothetical protein
VTPAVRPRPAVVAREPNEREWSKVVCDYARLTNWCIYHTWISVRSEKGWPDLALVRPPRLVLAELKREKGKVTENQAFWLDLLRQCAGVEVFIWRPSDWPEVQEVLR